MKNICVPTYIHLKKSLSPFCVSLYLAALWLGMIKTVGKMTMENRVHILNRKSVCKQLKGVGTVVAEL